MVSVSLKSHVSVFLRHEPHVGQPITPVLRVQTQHHATSEEVKVVSGEVVTEVVTENRPWLMTTSHETHKVYNFPYHNLSELCGCL